MAKRERISVATGEFTKSDGSKGTDWINIGTLITKDDGKKFMELIPYINFTSLPRKDGKLYAQVFDIQQRDGAHGGAVYAAIGADFDVVFNDYIAYLRDFAVGTIFVWSKSKAI